MGEMGSPRMGKRRVLGLFFTSLSSSASSACAGAGSASSTGIRQLASLLSHTHPKRARQIGHVFVVSDHWRMHARQKSVWPQPSRVAGRQMGSEQMTQPSWSSAIISHPFRSRFRGRGGAAGSSDCSDCMLDAATRRIIPRYLVHSNFRVKSHHSSVQIPAQHAAGRLSDGACAVQSELAIALAVRDDCATHHRHAPRRRRRLALLRSPRLTPRTAGALPSRRPRRGLLPPPRGILRPAQMVGGPLRPARLWTLSKERHQRRCDISASSSLLYY